jgi:Mg-chelatase subunit ChlD
MIGIPAISIQAEWQIDKDNIKERRENEMDKKQEGMAVYILLDRTGSMAPLWVEAVSSVNTYVKELLKEGADDRITLAVFDSYEDGMQFDVLRDTVSISEWKEIEVDEVSPRGMTPLLDALVKLITKAEEVNNGKTAIVVMTDGYENASRENSKEAAKAAIDRIQKKNWQVNFLGANFDGFSQAAGLGVARDYAMNFSVGRASAAMSSAAQAHIRYRNNRGVPSFQDEDRKNAGEDEVGRE